METWVIYSIVSLFFAGFFNFGMKIIAQRNYNTSYVSMLIYSVATIISLAYYLLFFYDWFETKSFILLALLAFWSALFYFLSTLSRIVSLKNIDTTIFFPLYKTFFPIIIALVSVFYFQESLEIKEIFGIGLWIAVPLLLITKQENQIQKNIKTWVIFVVITSILASVWSVFQKQVNIGWLDLELFVFLSLLFWTIVSWLSYFLWKKKSILKKHSQKGIYTFAFVLWLIQCVWSYVVIYAMEWNLAIVITINSFSILIPIILSVIFYWEEMTKKKAFVVFLSLVSVILFI